MSVKRVKATKYAEMIAVCHSDGDTHVYVKTKLSPTTYGAMFEDLVTKLTVASVPHVASGIVKAEEIVNFAHAVVRLAYDKMASDSMLAMSMPSDATIKRLAVGSVPNG